MDLPKDLPTETRAAYQRFLKFPLAGKKMLKKRVENYLNTLGGEYQGSGFIDLSLARKIGSSLIALIESSNDQELQHVQAACYYFIQSDDASPDLGSDDGFLDDTKVMNAVCGFLGRGELKIRV